MNERLVPQNLSAASRKTITYAVESWFFYVVKRGVPMGQHAKSSLALGWARVVAPFPTMSGACDQAEMRALEAEKGALQEELTEVSAPLDSAPKELDTARLEKAALAPTGRKYFFQVRMRVLGRYGDGNVTDAHKIL